MSTPELSGAAWRKSSHSGGNEGNCVELATTPERLVAARDSRNLSGPVLCFGPAEWCAFYTGVKSGSYDSPGAH